MEYTTLGNTGMTVSRLCLGCSNFGSGREWGVDTSGSVEILERAIDLGITFFDTANVYSTGESESILGMALDEYDRERVVVATKVNGEMKPGNQNSSGLSRKAIEQELANSLDRLGLESVDLYQIHRWDYDTPIEETLRTLNDCVRRGRVRYVGASSMWAHQFADALHASDVLGLERFATMQNHYNLAYREEEREMLPLCRNEGIGVVPWSPFAKGFLTRPLSRMNATKRARTEPLYKERAELYLSGGGKEINARVEEIADDKGASMAQIALAWLLHKDWVDAPIVGATDISHVEEAVEAVEVSLAASEIDYLEEPYRPLEITGHE
ncbi:aldo/keto reductase (plasmid) [Halorarum halophilum]|uniref:Aldo/keto reductase n=1 Tax=Halorarum halophilum TaxID=2743090 RepID=A0A7D5GHF9_9EURY|nr:aldo/keto reductase [Halobaculum halophilum]QLG29908.1 aldo/keto reductase [Halobaculum halophilum]